MPGRSSCSRPSASRWPSAAIAIRPGVILGPQFLFDDEGQNLLIVHTILSGGALYRDVYSQYGPIPAYVHALVARVFGNTPLVYLSLLAVVSSANVGLALRADQACRKPCRWRFSSRRLACCRSCSFPARSRVDTPRRRTCRSSGCCCCSSRCPGQPPPTDRSGGRFSSAACWERGRVFVLERLRPRAHRSW